MAPVTKAAPAPTSGQPRMPWGQQLMRFVGVGGVSAVVDYGLLRLGMVLGLPYAAAKAMSWVFGTLTAFVLNSRLTFQAEPSKRRLAGVVVLYVSTFVMQVGTFTLLYPWLLAWSHSENIASAAAFVVAQGLATTVNFIVQRTVIFRNV